MALLLLSASLFAARSAGQARHRLYELRDRGVDREWLQALLDYLGDRAARRSEAVREGLDDLRAGKLEPA